MEKAYNMDKDILRVLKSEREISKIIARLGKEISNDYKGKNLLLVGILKGSVVTLADLMRAITIPCSIDFMVVSSYGSGTQTSGVVRIIKDLEVPVEEYDILIVEDILDSGITLNYLRNMLQARNPRSLKICTLLNKPEGRKAPIEPDYVGTEIPDGFVVGFGLDYDEKYRNLPYVGIIKPEVVEENEKRKAEKRTAEIEKMKEIAEARVSGNAAHAAEKTGDKK